MKNLEIKLRNTPSPCHQWLFSVWTGFVHVQIPAYSCKRQFRCKRSSSRGFLYTTDGAECEDECGRANPSVIQCCLFGTVAGADILLCGIACANGLHCEAVNCTGRPPLRHLCDCCLQRQPTLCCSVAETTNSL